MRENICSLQLQCHFRLQQHEQAAQKGLQATEKEDPTCGQAWRKLGDARAHLSQFDEAVSCYEQALELGMPNAETTQSAIAALSMAWAAYSAQRTGGGGGGTSRRSGGPGTAARGVRWSIGRMGTGNKSTEQ